MSEQKINPELMLKAARLVYGESGDFVGFEPLTNMADAWALERALKKEGWVFWQVAGMYCGQRRNSDYMKPAQPVYQDECDTLLLLKCVSAQTGLELFGERE